MNLEEVRRQFEDNLPIYGCLKDEALFILEEALKEKRIKIHLISPRVKSLDSFMKKVEKKQTNNPFKDIQDITGLRVICLFLSDIPLIGKAIRNSFTIIREDNKIEDYDLSSFGYLSVHFIVKIKDEFSGTRYDKIRNLPFEIQVRTIAMDAWANVSHYLDYRNEMDVPKNLRRDFYALSGLFYVADTHFEMFYKSRQESLKQMEEQFKIAVPQTYQEINLDSLTTYLRKKFPDREHSAPNNVSELLQEMAETGYTSFKEIDKIIDKAWGAFTLYEEDLLYKSYILHEKLYDVGVLRSILALMNKDYNNRFFSHDNLENYRNFIED